MVCSFVQFTEQVSFLWMFVFTLSISAFICFHIHKQECVYECVCVCVCVCVCAYSLPTMSVESRDHSSNSKISSSLRNLIVMGMSSQWGSLLDTQRHRDTETQTHTQTQRHTDTHTHTETQRQRDTQTHRHTNT